jgi:electron transfer flavoprotein alpha subunit
MSLSSVLVILEPSNGSFSATSLELLSHARSLSSSVNALTWGDGASHADVAGDFGAGTLYVASFPSNQLPGAPVAKAIADVVAASSPDAILIPTSYDGRDIAGRLSARLDRPVLTNASGVAASNGVLTEHQVFGGSAIVKATFTSDGPAIVVVRAKSFASESCGGAPASVSLIEVGDLGVSAGATVVSNHVEERTGPSLEDASVVVSGGRGLGEAANYALVQEVATLLHGAAGASRAIVDSGWVPYSSQVGQTGKTVKPTVYIACGISGATQHMVGMKGSTNIIAINKDAEAPIFQIADLGIVGDVTKVLPALIAALKARG